MVAPRLPPGKTFLPELRAVGLRPPLVLAPIGVKSTRWRARRSPGHGPYSERRCPFRLRSRHVREHAELLRGGGYRSVPSQGSDVVPGRDGLGEGPPLWILRPVFGAGLCGRRGLHERPVHRVGPAPRAGSQPSPDGLSRRAAGPSGPGRLPRPVTGSLRRLAGAGKGERPCRLPLFQVPVWV